MLLRKHGIDNNWMNSFKRIIHSFDPFFSYRYELGNLHRVLDLGCGKGSGTYPFSVMFPQVRFFGVDLLHPSDVLPYLTYAQLDLEKERLPFVDGFFDAILLNHVLEHLHSPRFLGGEIHRVLARNGTIYVETPNWTTLFVPSIGPSREQGNGFNFYDDPTHVRPYTKQGLYDFLFRFCNLRVRKVGVRRNYLKLPFDLFRFPLAYLSGNRDLAIRAFWNLYGWSIYATGVKE